jgi:Rad3-related DNA helicase
VLAFNMIPCDSMCNVSSLLVPHESELRMHECRWNSQVVWGLRVRCKDHPAVDKFVEGILQNVMDIEELAEKGARQAVCPYYAAREAVSQADFVLVPYSCLIHRSVASNFHGIMLLLYTPRFW